MKNTVITRAINYQLTPKLRWVKKIVVTDEGNIGTYVSKLQQMWRGDDGSVKWEDVEEVVE